MKTSEVLNLTADLLEERGWSAGSGWIDDGSSPLCLEGALAAVLGVRMVGTTCDAYRAVSSYIESDKALFLWNDHAPWEGNDWRSNRLRVPNDYDASMEAGRQVVITTLRAAAVIEAAKETVDRIPGGSPNVRTTAPKPTRPQTAGGR